MVRPAASPAPGPVPPGAGPRIDFELPDELAAPAPPEKRGLERDGVRLLAVDRRPVPGPGRPDDPGNGFRHGRFRDLPGFLKPGDCLVLNASRTLPASLAARLRAPSAVAPGRGAPVEVRLARRMGKETWSALLLDAFENPLEAVSGVLEFGGGFAPSPASAHPALTADIEGPDPANSRLRQVRFSESGADLMGRLSRLGQPVRYWYASRPWELDWYQTVFAREPGSVEMPSAGRAFTWRLLLDLKRRGVGAAFLVLHAGLSSYMDREFDATHPVSVEPYRISPEAAGAINAAREAGGRIIAVGTTAVRAIESAADAGGRVRPGEASTALRITRDYRLRVADGLITGFHEPEASHLDLLSAFLPPDRLRAVYAEALKERYLWHEFGDINLIL